MDIFINICAVKRNSKESRMFTYEVIYKRILEANFWFFLIHFLLHRQSQNKKIYILRPNNEDKTI